MPPDRLTKYSELATEDTERYKKEMQAYNGRQEAKMRDESLKASQSYAIPEAAKPTAVPMMGNRGPPMQAYEISQMSPGGYMTQAASANLGGGYGYPGGDPYGYPTSLSSVYQQQYGGYPGMGGGGGAAEFGGAYTMQGIPAGISQSQLDASTAAMYGMNGGYGYG